MGPIIPTKVIQYHCICLYYVLRVFPLLISSFDRQYRLHGVQVQVARVVPFNSHMFFSNENYIYTKVTEREAIKVREVFKTFEIVSVQKINLTKFSVFFSANFAGCVRNRVFDALRVQEVQSIVLI